MYRVLPVQNKYLEKKWNKLQHDHHYRRMKETKSLLVEEAQGNMQNKQKRAGTAGLNGRGGQMRNYKKEAMMEARFTEIERENRILLEKMTSIMKNGASLRPQT